MRHFIGLFGLLLALCVWGTGCELTSPDPPLDISDITDISYSQHVQPLFNEACVACHGSGEAAQGLRLDGWTRVIQGSTYGEAVIPYDADRSLLVKMLTELVGGPHPADQGADTLTTREVDFLKRWIDEGARNDADQVPYEDADQLLYVPNQNSALISVVDTEANVVIRTVDLQGPDLGYSPEAQPHHTAVEPDGSFWYVSLIGENVVLKFDRTNRLVGEASFDTPGMLAVHPSRDLLYVGRSMSAVSPPQRIGVIQRSDMVIEEVDVLFPRPHALAVMPDGEYVLTASLSENRVITVNTTTQDVGFLLLSGPLQAIVQFAVSPDGTRTALTSQLTNQVVLLNTAAPPDIARIGAIEVGAAPWHPVFSPDGSTLYVPEKDANRITTIDMQALSVGTMIEGPGLAEPHGSAIRPDGRYLYVTNRNTQGLYQPRYDFGANTNVGTLVVVDTETNQIVKVLEVGQYPAGLPSLF